MTGGRSSGSTKRSSIALRAAPGDARSTAARASSTSEIGRTRSPGAPRSSALRSSRPPRKCSICRTSRRVTSRACRTTRSSVSATRDNAFSTKPEITASGPRRSCAATPNITSFSWFKAASRSWLASNSRRAGPSSACTATRARSSSGRNGLGKKSTPPAAKACVIACWSNTTDKNITGVRAVAASARNTRQTSKPPMPGMQTSSNTTSGRIRRANASPSRPLAASTTS